MDGESLPFFGSPSADTSLHLSHFRNYYRYTNLFTAQPKSINLGVSGTSSKQGIVYWQEVDSPVYSYR